ncbi:MAG: threonine synthase [Candidatus Levybacteria bacterium]|nr:threonine synthase [Candidatus Levybacteria bacterium]
MSTVANLARLECISGDAAYPIGPDPIYQCKNPHELGANLLDVIYDFPKKLDPEKLKVIWRKRRMLDNPLDASGVWRFRELLPFVDEESSIVTLGEGNTRFLQSFESAKYVSLPRLYFKHQGDNPTGSFKDPGMSGAITQAKILGVKAVACASTGNTSASMAAYAKRAGILPIVFIPEGQISYGKLSQALDFGALTLQIEGDFDKAMELVMQIMPEIGVYIVNSINPFRIEGQKTIVAELLEQMEWQVPDRIVVPGGNLGHASSIWKGLRELKTLGFIKKYPKITVVQARGADPLYRGVISGNPDNMAIVEDARTLATAIKIGKPVSYRKALDGVRATNGWVTEVSEQQIADAKAIIGRDGIGAEPASAVTVAGLKRIVEEGTDEVFDREERVVAILTGNMLKDPDYPVAYHSGKLHEGSTTKSIVSKDGPKIKSTFGNKPMRVPADPNVIKNIILQKIAV